MRKIFIFLPLLFIALSAIAQGIIPLNENWKFRRSGEDTWYDARVPGTVHTDLMAQNLIEDPYYGTNFLKQDWIKDASWEYKTEFSVDDDLFNSDKIELIFHGLDTKAEVFLNDSILFRSDNMFRSWTSEVSQKLKEGLNTLRVQFYPPSETSRKAMFQSGIDNPKIQTCGIWKPVELVAWNRVKMYNTGIIQNEISEDEVKITVHTEMEVVRPFIGDLDIFLDGEIVKSSKVDMNYGKNYQNISFSVRKPRRWWPAGMGDQNQYDVAVVLKNEGQTVASHHKKIGIRTIKIIDTDDRSGLIPQLLVNNKKMQVVFGNFVPMDFFIPRADSLRYKNMLKAIVNTGFNVVRVWGGGIYEKDVFYNLCDEAGILVVQDLMFDYRIANTDSVVSDMLAEAEENMRRLYHHPSLMFWTDVNGSFLCENSDLTNAVIRHDIKTIFSKNREKDYSTKDRLWSEWLKKMQGSSKVSYSCPAAVYSVSGKDLFMDDPVWVKRSNPEAILELKGDLASNFPEAHDSRELIYQSQWLQAKSIMSTEENYVNYIPQINESWPGISMSVIDYSGKMKGAAYQVRRNVHKEVVGVEEKEKYVRIHVFSIPGDAEEKFDLDVRVMDFNGKLFYKEEKKVKTDVHKPVVHTDISKKEIFKKRQNGSAYICVKLKKEDLVISESRMFFVPFNEIKVEEAKISLDVFEDEGETKVEVKSDKLAMGVVLYTENDAVEWSDNFFNLDPGEKKIVSVKGSKDIKLLKNNIRATVLYRNNE